MLPLSERVRRRRVWAEEVPLEELGRVEVLGALASREIDLLAAVRPWNIDDAAQLVLRCRDAGVHIGLWPMLGDADGRWASAENVDRFAALLAELMDRLAANGALPDELVIDLEPPIWAVRRLVERLRPAPVMGARKVDAQARFRVLVEEMRARGVGVTAAVVPLVLADAEDDGGHAGWQRMLGTPVDGVGFERVEVMLYTSLLEGYSRGVVSRSAACAMLHSLSARARVRFGARASVALGAVWTGALGHEPVYRSVEELSHDVSIARAAGVESLSLFDLGGVLRRPPIEAWLDAFVETPAGSAPPRASLRGRAAWWAVRSVGSLARRPR